MYNTRCQHVDVHYGTPGLGLPAEESDTEVRCRNEAQHVILFTDEPLDQDPPLDFMLTCDDHAVEDVHELNASANMQFMVGYRLTGRTALTTSAVSPTNNPAT